jgi:hypothetical protein
MAASNEWWEYHLTPRGWEDGSSKLDSGGGERKDPPPDRVLTIRVSEYMSSTFSPLERGESEEWRSSDSALVASLIEQYGARP